VVETGVESFSPKTEVESWAAKGARPSGRFNVRKACDLQMFKTTRAVKRRERRAPTVWLWFYLGKGP
jgi:hypothetical protein